MKQFGHLNSSEETGTGCPITSNYRRTPPNKHGCIGRPSILTRCLSLKFRVLLICASNKNIKLINHDAKQIIDILYLYIIYLQFSAKIEDSHMRKPWIKAFTLLLLLEIILIF